MRNSLLTLALCAFAHTAALAQTDDIHLRSFDVVSIRPAPATKNSHLIILPDGYEALGMSLSDTLFLAYLPGPFLKHMDEMKGIPSWAHNDLYDFRAKVAPADVAQWQSLHQSIMQAPALLQSMLRQVLEERCKLRVHSTQTTTDGYALHIRNNSPALVEDSSLPVGDPGQDLLDGGRFVYSAQNGERTYTFYNTSMATFATFISLWSQHAIEDRTGLKGRYKFTIHRIEAPPAEPGTTADTEIPVPWDLASIGLKVDKEKVQSTLWIVDNIEKPTAN